MRVKNRKHPRCAKSIQRPLSIDEQVWRTASISTTWDRDKSSDTIETSKYRWETDNSRGWIRGRTISRSIRRWRKNDLDSAVECRGGSPSKMGEALLRNRSKFSTEVTGSVRSNFSNFLRFRLRECFSRTMRISFIRLSFQSVDISLWSENVGRGGNVKRWIDESGETKIEWLEI